MCKRNRIGPMFLTGVALGICTTPARAVIVAHEAGKVRAAPPLVGDSFGSAVALFGDFLAVAAYGNNDSGVLKGAVYVFRKATNGSWVQQVKLHASDGGQFHWFGWAVAMNSNWLFVTTTEDGQAATDAGAAYVFRRNNAGTPNDPTDDTWIEAQKLMAPDATPNEEFGYSVAASEDWLAVGAWRDDWTCGFECDTGSVYLYRRADGGTPADPSDDSWVYSTELHATPAAFFNIHFGASVALDPNRLVVGATDDGSGAAYVFRRNDGGTPTNLTDDAWIQEARLFTSDPNQAYLGQSVAIRGDRVIAGAPNQDQSGSAYVFHRDDNGTPLNPNDDTWEQTARLTSWYTAGNNQFGNSVALGSDFAVVGALFDYDTVDLYRAGAVYAFKLRGLGTPDYGDDLFTPYARLTASDAAISDVLGRSLALDGETFAVGAEGDDDGVSQSGSAYLFSMSQIAQTGVDIPAASTWGLIILALTVLTAGTVIPKRHQATRRSA